MKIFKKKNKILWMMSLGLLSSFSIANLVFFLNYKNNLKDQESNENIKDVKIIVKVLEDKKDEEKIITLSSDSKGKIIADNQEKIVTKLKSLIEDWNLSGVKITVSMQNDEEISTNKQKITVKVSKGNYWQELSQDKSYFVKRPQNDKEIVDDLNFVKRSLESLLVKNLEIYIKNNNKTIVSNKNVILLALKEIKGYSNIDFKGSIIKVKSSSNVLPPSEEKPIDIIFVLSKGDFNINVFGFKCKQIDAPEIQKIKRELQDLKTNLKNLRQKILNVYVPSLDKKIKNNKSKIIKAIKKIDGYSNINFNGAKLGVKSSEQSLPLYNEIPIPITLFLLKNNISIEINGFSAKQIILDQAKIMKIISKIKNKDILIAPNVSTKNQSEIENAIKKELKNKNNALTRSNLAKITTNISSIELGVKTEVKITITINSYSQKLKIYVEKIDLLKNSNITKGQYGTIFQDKFKNLWAMGYFSKPQVLKAKTNDESYVKTGWISNNKDKLLKGLNIDDGFATTIFQDSFGNLWAMGYARKLQVLEVNSSGEDYVDLGWNNSDKLLKNSKIDDGQQGTIFQDFFGNLWAMGNNSKLQVLKKDPNQEDYVDTGWTENNNENGEPLLKNSSINDGLGGRIFQDQFKNLWAMGHDSKLQVLKVNKDKSGYDDKGWTNDIETEVLLKNSNIDDGKFGTIFQDEFKNLWIMGFGSKLQVLEVNKDGDGYKQKGWINNQKLLKNSKINDGNGGTIFQDKFKNLWAMGNGSKLQVLKAKPDGTGYVEAGWTNDVNNEKLLQGSKISNGQFAKIFQDNFNNLWIIGIMKETHEHSSNLQVLKAKKDVTSTGYVDEGWINNNTQGLLKNSNIHIGRYAVIFQDQFKNLWIMGSNSKLQVLQVNNSEKDYLESWQS